MFCQSCGTENKNRQSYCSRCGANMNARKDTQDLAMAEAIKAVTHPLATLNIFALGILFAGLLVLKKEALLSDPLLGLFVGAVVFILTLVDTALALQLSRVVSAIREAGGREVELKSRSFSELNPASPRGLGEPVSSVTEHTTRTLEHVAREPRN